MYMKVCLEDGVTCCDTNDLDGPGDDLELGALDSYDHNSGLGMYIIQWTPCLFDKAVGNLTTLMLSN